MTENLQQLALLSLKDYQDLLVQPPVRLFLSDSNKMSSFEELIIFLFLETKTSIVVYHMASGL